MKIFLGVAIGAISSGILWVILVVSAHHFDTSALFFGSKAYLLAAVVGLIFGIPIGALVGGVIPLLKLGLIKAGILSMIVYGVIGIPILFSGGVFYPGESFAACIGFNLPSGVINGAIIWFIVRTKGVGRINVTG